MIGGRGCLRVCGNIHKGDRGLRYGVLTKEGRRDKGCRNAWGNVTVFKQSVKSQHQNAISNKNRRRSSAGKSHWGSRCALCSGRRSIVRDDHVPSTLARHRYKVVGFHPSTCLVVPLWIRCLPATTELCRHLTSYDLLACSD